MPEPLDQTIFKLMSYSDPTHTPMTPDRWHAMERPGGDLSQTLAQMEAPVERGHAA